MKFETVYKLRVIYKSGYATEFEVTKYSINKDIFQWTLADNTKVRPLHMNYDEVAAVWLVGERKRLAWFNK
jgi:hypothetical protein